MKPLSVTPDMLGRETAEWYVVSTKETAEGTERGKIVAACAEAAHRTLVGYYLHRIAYELWLRSTTMGRAGVVTTWTDRRE